MTDFQSQGWVRFYRKSIDSSVWKNPIVWFIWSWCLLKANHKDKKFPFNGNDIIIKRGSFITGREKALKELPAITAQNYKTGINYLKLTNRITIETNNKFSIITIIKYNDYQLSKKLVNNELTNKLNNEQTTTKQPLTTNNNIKNIKKNTSVAKATVREPKISYKLISALKEFSPTGELDGDYKMDNLFPAKVVAKQIIQFTGKELDLNNPEHHDEIIAQFKGLISKLDDFERNNATKMSYIKYNFNRLAAKASKK